MPDFTGWPVWAILALLLLTNQYTLRFFNKILSTAGLASAKHEESEIETERWMRQRADWAADKAFDILEATIKDYQEENRAHDKVLADLMVAIQKNTSTIGQQVEMTRLLAHNAAQVDDRLKNIETVWLKHDKEVVG